jgi:hypothetical protein
MNILFVRLLVGISATGWAMLSHFALASDAAPVGATSDRNPRAGEATKLTAEQASDALERDWLFQALGEPLRARTAKDIAWARELAARLRARHPALALAAEGQELEALEQRWAEVSREASSTSRGESVAVAPQWIWFPEGRPSEDAPAATRWFFRRFEAPAGVRAAELRVATDDACEVFQSSVLDFARLLFIDQPLPQGPQSLHEAIHRLGMMAVPGGRLVVLEGLHPGGRVRPLAPDQPGSFWRPDLSFDATKVLFGFKPEEEKSFHLYEMKVDGTGRRQLTDSEYDDIDPLYLPGGHILFTTTRGNSYVRCGPFIDSYILARCDADGRNVDLISHNGEPDFVPALLPDGRMIYSRWEYSDKPLWRLQKLWTTGQDGTGKDRQRVEPGVFFSAEVCQGVPGVTRDLVKFLRVFQLDHKTYSTWATWNCALWATRISPASSVCPSVLAWPARRLSKGRDLVERSTATTVGRWRFTRAARSMRGAKSNSLSVSISLTSLLS